jgi:hypothetical protein
VRDTAVINDALKKYLDARGATPVDPEVLQRYGQAMASHVIPKIIDDTEERERLAVELRYSPSIAARTRKGD